MSWNNAVRRAFQGRCQQCGAVSQATQYHGFDLTIHPEGKDVLLEGDFFHWRCPHCGAEADIGYPCWYYDPRAGLGITILPGLTSGSDEEELERMNRNLQGLARPHMTHRAVGNFYAMQELVRIREAGLDDRLVQVVKPLLVGQMQSMDLQVWNGFFAGVSIPEEEEEPVSNVLYASEPEEPPDYGQPIYWYDIHLTNREVIRAGVNEAMLQQCADLLVRGGETAPDDGQFHCYDLDWAIALHSRIWRDEEPGEERSDV